MAKRTTRAGTLSHTVLLVDDHPAVRRGIAAAVSDEPDLEVCSEAADAHEALESMQRETPDVAVVDLGLTDSSGLKLIKDMQVRFPDVPVLVLSMRDEGFYADRALRAGARGYVTRDEGCERVVEAIRQVLNGQVCVSDRLVSRVLGKLVGGRAEQERCPMETLSDRELQVLEMIGGGLATREIAARLHISPKTVDSHASTSSRSCRSTRPPS